jgi:hypothetical protein
MHGSRRDVNLRHLREGHAENVTFPSFPAVHFKGMDVGGKEERSRHLGTRHFARLEFARNLSTDGDTALNLFENFLCCIRLRDDSPKGMNNSTLLPDAKVSLITNLLPTFQPTRCRCLWERERSHNFPQFHFGLKTCPSLEVQTNCQEWSLNKVLLAEEDLLHLLCFTTASTLRELLYCQCGVRLYCLEACETSTYQCSSMRSGPSPSRGFFTRVSIEAKKKRISSYAANAWVSFFPPVLVVRNLRGRSIRNIAL